MASENSGDIGPQRITPSSAGRVEAQARDARKMMARLVDDVDNDTVENLNCDRDMLRVLADRIERQPFALQSDFARRDVLPLIREISNACWKIRRLADKCNERAIEAAKRDGKV